MRTRFVKLAIAIVLIAVASCKSDCTVDDNLSEVILFDYDQVNNFRTYYFERPIPWPVGTGQKLEPGIKGVGHNGTPLGFWVTYVICSLRNEASKAKPFNYDVHKFFVEFEGKKFFYQPLTAFTYQSDPGSLSATAAANDLVNPQFRTETQVGPDTETFQKGFNATLNYRFSIYVTKSLEGPVDPSKEINLRYEGHPNIPTNRNQPPKVEDPTFRGHLLTVCRPPAK